MGSLRLECPLCCNETFPTPTSLKYHLLSMIDNLLCTICGMKFNNIRSLAEHISTSCKINLKEELVEDKKISNDSNDTPTTSKTDEEEEEFEEETQTQEVNEEESMQTEEEVTVQIKTEGEVEEEEEEVFYCSSCAVSFNNVDEHLEEFHKGQEVYVEDNPDSDKNNSQVFLVDGNEGTEDTEMPVMNTIQEEECTDKAGRLYTRKVVQIEKFWDEKGEKSKKDRPDPIVQFFAVRDGVAVKIEKDQENLEDGSSILQVYQCSLCSVHFTKEKQYNNHKCAPMKYQCTECDASFPQSRSLSAHMRMHKSVKKAAKHAAAAAVTHQGPFICVYCEIQFSTYKSLRLHVRMHDPVKTKEIEPPVSYGIMGEDIEDKNEERQMFTCKVCNKDYDEVYRHIHMKSHVEEENYDCTICNRKFFTESNLEMHMRVHNAEKTSVCSYCKKEFDDYSTLEEHLKQHVETRPYECQYCSRRFVRPHEKVKHERIHTGEKPHVCDLCGKAFRVSYCLTLHMRTHSGSRPYQCQECGKRFKAHSVYNHHLLIHSNVRKYKCPYCPKAFKTAVQLAGHKNTHTKPFTCTECNRPFASLYAVRSHMETHKQDNNLKYNCFACGASYARAFALRDHIKAHHADQWETNIDTMEESSNAATSILPHDENDILILERPLLADSVELEEETVTEN